MTSTHPVGRIVGGLLLLHLVGGLMLPYILLNRIVRSPEFPENAAQNAVFMRAPVLLFLLAAAVTLAITISAYPVLRQYNRRLAICSLALGIANLPLQLIESSLILSMLSLSQQYVSAGQDTMVKAIAVAVLSTRRWLHYTQLLTIVSWIFVLFAALWRARLIPRLLGVFGLVTCAMQITGVPLRAVLGYPLVTEMAIPLGPAYASLGLWLVVKGFPNHVPRMTSESIS